MPTFAEQGYDIVMGSDRGLGAPAGIPEEALAALEDAVAQAMDDPEFEEAAKRQDLPLFYQNAEEFHTHLETVDGNLREIWQESPWVQ